MIRHPRKILAIKLRSLGDTVLLAAPLEELRRVFPDSEIHVAATTPWASLLEGHPAVSRIWKYERHPERTSRAKAIASLALRLRRERYDCVLCFHASPSSAALAYATGASVRSIHFHGHKDKNRYSTVLVPGKGVLKPVIERDMDTVRALGVVIPSGRLPRLYLTAQEIQHAGDRIRNLGVAAPIMAMGLGASRPTKSWPLERFSALAVSWCRARHGSVVVVVDEDEEPLTRDFLKAVDDHLAHAGAEPAERSTIRSRIAVVAGLPIRQLAAVLHECSVFVGNDSGPKHIAVAVGAPTVSLFGPEDPFEWHPYPSDKHPYFFVDGLACRRDALPGMRPWCGIPVCIEEQHRCMREIDPEAVWKECDRVARK